MCKSILQLQNVIQMLVVIKPESKNNDKTKFIKVSPSTHTEDSTSSFFLNKNRAYVPSTHQGLDDRTLPVWTGTNSQFHNHIGE